MAWDIIKPTGSTKASRPEAGGANTRSVPMLGIVKDNIDPVRQGRLRVYLEDFGGKNPEDSKSWSTVSYMSTFFGATRPSGAKDDLGSATKNPSSYGMWNSPPDIGSKVVCIFINGDPNFGYYIGCVPDAETLHMVPAIAGSDHVTMNSAEAKSYGGATRLPVANLNTNNKSVVDSAGFLTAARPVHSYTAAVLQQQGLLRDPVRGVIGSSSQRETPSRVGYGVSTPGRPIYTGGFTDENLTDSLKANASNGKLTVEARRGGHSFVMDDGDVVGRDQLVRLRTSTGHQILMSDSGQCLFIIHANGQSWIELGKEGTIDMYATNSVNIRTQGDLNLHADNNLNINATKALNIAAESITINSEKDTVLRTGADFKQYTVGKYTVKVDSGMSMLSAGEASYASKSSTLYLNGSKINLNSGSASLVPASVKPITIIKHTDTLYDSTVGFAAAPGKLSSIVSRAPAHAPWAAAGLGVDVKTDLSASAALPASPTAAVTTTNTAAATTAGDITPVSAAAIASVPVTNKASGAIDSNTVAAMAAQAAATAATSSDAMANAVKSGAGVVDNKLVVGICAASAENLVDAGTLKPGAAQIIKKIVDAGGNAKDALQPNMFTGKPGAPDSKSLLGSAQAQVSVFVSNVQQAQKALTNAGAMTGKESPTQVSGLLLGGITSGVSSVVNAIAGGASGITNVTTKLVKAISAGNFAASLGSSLTGGLGSIAGALGGAMNTAKGAVASAFAKITAGFGSLVPNTALKLPSGEGDLSSLASGVNAIPGGAKAITSAIDSAKGALNTVPGVSSITGMISSGSTSGTGNLLSTAVAGISATAGATVAGASATLKAVVGGLSAAGASPEKLATTAVNTCSRDSVDSALKAALGEKTPPPNYAGNPATFGVTPATLKVNSIAEKQAQVDIKATAYFDASTAASAASRKYYELSDTLPDPGDPAIAAALVAKIAAEATLKTSLDAYITAQQAVIT